MSRYQSKNKLGQMASDYANLRTLPATLSVAFIAASLYQFGGISTIDLVWLDYQLTTEASVVVSLVSLLVAFASSATNDLGSYETWEMAVIAAGPVVILGDQYTTEITDLLLELGDPLGMQIAFILTILSWGVAVK